MNHEIVAGAGSGRDQKTLEPETMSSFSNLLAIRSALSTHVVHVEADDAEGTFG